ncbi:MAG: cellulase family glycosylhydrolase [Candidatus Saganbacteria bacterium]|nr:cellulase family glycosylhydrolase [Candidatus Saganbacteria bacterium]
MTNSANGFVKVSGNNLIKNGSPFIIKGAALLDDTTIWNKGKKEPNLNYIEERDYAFTAVGKINTVRLVLKMDYFIDNDGNIKEKGFDFINKQLGFAKKHGLLILLDMHMPTGGAIQDFVKTEANRAFWESEKSQELFIKGWQAIAQRYKNNHFILGYEIMNEAVVSDYRYWQLMKKTIDAIREVDQNHIIAIQSTQNWQLQKLEDDNILYVWHFYKPLYFTHQNVCWTNTYNTNEQVKYPGNAKDYSGKTSYFDKNELQKSMGYIGNLKKQHNIPIIIGEFCVSTYADEESMRHWIKDIIDLTFENNLNGYIYWRQIDNSTGDLSQNGKCTTTIINKSGYFSPAQFFGIRPEFNRNFDALQYYKNF